jgi:hypothetical protein
VTDAHGQDNCILLGLGEQVEVRMPTLDEQLAHAVGEREPIIVVHHPDRGDEIVPARGRRVAARSYGVKLLVEGEGEW